MTEQDQDFEAELARRYAHAPALPDREAFAAGVVHGAERRAKVRSIVMLAALGAGGMIAAAQVLNADALRAFASLPAAFAVGGHIGEAAVLAIAGAALAVYASLRVAEG